MIAWFVTGFGASTLVWVVFLVGIKIGMKSEEKS